VYDYGWRRPSRTAVALGTFGAAFVTGCIPWFLGLRQIDQPLYDPVTVSWSFGRLWARLLETVRSDVWQFLGAYDHRLAFGTALLMIALAVIGLTRLRLRREDVLAAGVLTTCVAFWLGSTAAYGGAVRYLVLALPVVYGLGAFGVTHLWNASRLSMRVVAGVIALVLAAGFYAPRVFEVGEIAAGRGEQHEHWPGGFDPRPALGEIESAGYRVCYADFWLAYKLEWLNVTGVEFIPYRSVDRTQARSLRLAATPGKKCLVTPDGRVVELSEQQQAALRAETVAHANRRSADAATSR
jgi:hypothetical protein